MTGRRLALAAALCAMVPSTHAAQERSTSPPPASPPPRAVFDKYCVTCHNTRIKTAGLALDALDLERVADHAETWEKVVRKLRTGAMPPVGRSSCLR